METLAILGIIFAVAGTACFCILGGVTEHFRTMKKICNASTIATIIDEIEIVDDDAGVSYHPVYEFMREGELTQYESFIGVKKWNKFYDIGDTTVLFYDTENDSNYYIPAEDKAIDKLKLTLKILGGVFAPLGLGFLLIYVLSG